MDTNSGYKDRAISSLSGNWGNGAIATLMVYAISGIPTYTIAVSAGEEAWGNLGSLWSLLMLPLGWGLTIFFLSIARTEKPELGHIFDGFKEFWRIFSTLFVRNLFICLWTLLLVIPGIIKTYSYAMTDYILKDHPEMGVNESIELSMAMMKGHKMDLFLLHLSFIGWLILTFFTLGLGFLLLYPYFSTAQALFYEDLKEEFEMKKY